MHISAYRRTKMHPGGRYANFAVWERVEMALLFLATKRKLPLTFSLNIGSFWAYKLNMGRVFNGGNIIVKDSVVRVIPRIVDEDI